MTTFANETLPSTSYDNGSLPSSSWSGEEISVGSFLLLEDGGYALLEDGEYLLTEDATAPKVGEAAWSNLSLT